MPLPDATDLLKFLQSASLLPQSGLSFAQSQLDLQGAIDSAYAEFQKLTKRTPFLGDGTMTTRTFRVEGDCVEFTGTPGLFALDTGADAINSNGTNYILDTNVQLLPLNSPQDGKPYTYLKLGIVNQSGLFPGEYAGYGFYGVSFGFPGFIGSRINIRGQWCYCLTLSADVKRALLCGAAAQIAPQLEHAITGGVTEYREEDEYKKFGGSPFTTQVNSWNAQFRHAMQEYTFR